MRTTFGRPDQGRGGVAERGWDARDMGGLRGTRLIRAGRGVQGGGADAVGRRGCSAEELAGVVCVKLSGGLGYDTRSVGQLGQTGDSEQGVALAAADTAIGRLGGQPPAVCTARTFGDNVHMTAPASGVTTMCSKDRSARRMEKS
jgi:hypothetical protein